MKNISLIKYSPILLAVILFSAITSCSSIKNVKYFADIPDSGKIVQLKNVPFIEPAIQTDDILTVNIQSIDPATTQVLTLGNQQSSAVGNSSAAGTGGQTVTGFLVDRNGDIEIPVLGKIHLAGLTTDQAREVIRKQAEINYKHVTVNLRFANFKITIYGEVNKPGTYVVSNERVNILDALGLAGDLTIYGRRENILLQRNYADGKREVVRLDLTKSDILNSPYYFLRQNDYIYVEPVKTKVVASDAIQNRNISITTTVISFLVSVLVVVIARRN